MVWKEAIDPTTKHLYYYNTATGAQGMLRYKSVPPLLYLKCTQNSDGCGSLTMDV